MELLLPVEYPIIVLAGVFLCFECWIIGFTIVRNARMKTFTKEFMSQFDKEHKAAFGEDTCASVGGFPDAGDGRYSAQLKYADWYHFNNAMRAHMNFIETLPVILIILGVSGLLLPLSTAIIGWSNVVFRMVYTICYARNGPSARAWGVLGGPLPLYVLGLVSIGFCIYEMVVQ